jgi:hypothetical protein
VSAFWAISVRWTKRAPAGHLAFNSTVAGSCSVIDAEGDAALLEPGAAGVVSSDFFLQPPTATQHASAAPKRQILVFIR